MKLEHSFSVPTTIDEAWKILLDIERIGPCMPGAAIESVDGDDFTGSVKVKLGPIGLTYKGKASFVEKDEAAHRAVIDARGRDARGNGTAAAKVTATLSDQGGSTLVQVDTDLDITGKPAQFGRGVMVDVGNKLIGQFADNLSAEISSGGSSAEPVAEAAPEVASEVAAETKPAARKPSPKPAAATDAENAATATPIDEAAVIAEADAPAAFSAPNGEAADVTPGMSDDAETEPLATAPSAAAPAAPVSAASSAPPAPVNGHQVKPAAPVREVEPINLLESAGPAVAKRLAPPLAAALIAFVLIILRRRKR